MDLARTPVIVGVGQRTDRTPDVEDPVHPRQLLSKTVRRAVEDAGGFSLADVDILATIPIHDWKTTNQPGALAQELGIGSSRVAQIANGGEAGVTGANWLAQEIADGNVGLGILTGANVKRSTELAGRLGRVLEWEEEFSGTPEQVGRVRVGHSPQEAAAGLELPPFIYPLFENALRHRYGRTLDEHMMVIGRLFAAFTEVAQKNPYAWFPTARSAEELITVTPSNRLVGYPYTKYLNAILNTDQSAALILTSAARARELGISEDKWIYWHGGNHAEERAWFASARPDFASTPSMMDSHLGALANAGIGIDDVDFIDFYSCFPAAVEMAVKMLGLDLNDSRGFTVTGGLPYAGGPGSSYTLHSLATMVGKLRENPGTTGLVTGNGYYVTKHAASVWSSRPFQGARLASTRPGPQPSEGLTTDPVEPTAESGRGTIDTYTVLYGRDGRPARGIVIGHLEDESRFLANTDSGPEFLESFAAEERIGTTGTVSPYSMVPTFEPD